MRLNTEKTKYLILAIIVILQIFLLVIAGMLILRARANSEVIHTTLDTENSYYAQWRDDSWYVSSDTAIMDKTPDWIFVPDRTITAGSYTILVDYECDEDQTMEVIASNDLTRPKYSFLPAKLLHSKNHLTYRTKLFGDCDVLQIIIHFNGQGGIRVQQVSLIPDSYGAKQNFLFLFCILSVLDVLF